MDKVKETEDIPELRSDRASGARRSMITGRPAALFEIDIDLSIDRLQ
jgi:hypothetical protein